MRARSVWLAWLVIAGVGGAGAQNTLATKSGATDCAALMKLKLPNVRITDAFAPHPPGSPATAAPLTRCLVVGVIDKETGFFVFLPDKWNGRFVMSGGAGFDGILHNNSNASVTDGFAVAGTDGGHVGSPAFGSWALHNEERMVSYFYLAVHRTTEVAKDIIRSYYGSSPVKSYFDGFSNGGRQALVEAARYPDDFDGIVARAPAWNVTGMLISSVRNLQAQYPSGDFSTPLLNADNLRLLRTKVLDACGTRDGVHDSVIDDPRACDFKVASLPACPEDVPARDCVTLAQRQAIGTIYSPVRINGTTIYPGQPLGGELGWLGETVGVDSNVIGATHRGAPTEQGALATEFFKYFVFGDSAWDYSRYDLSRAPTDIRRLDSLMTGTNIGAFLQRGGKLILAHGWSDPVINPLSTITYYDSVIALPGARNAVRLFVMPGVGHCDGGEGCDTVDWITPIVDWVERGVVPARIVARKLEAASTPSSARVTIRSRPLCPYPQRAAYSGAGSAHDERNFICK